MNRTTFYGMVLLLAMHCNISFAQGLLRNNRCMEGSLAVPKVHKTFDYDYSWNEPSFGLFASKYYGFAEKIQHLSLKEGLFAKEMYALPGSYCQSVMVYCQDDTCQCNKLMLCIKCPKNETLVRWVSGTLFSDKHIENCWDHNETEKDFTAIEDLLPYVVNHCKEKWAKTNCRHARNPEGKINQYGMVIGDIWRTKKCITFMKGCWTDDSDNAPLTSDVSFVTLNSKTGQEMSLSQLVSAEDAAKVKALLPQYMSDSKGKKWIKGRKDIPEEESTTFLFDNISGAAVIKEGLVLYALPETISKKAGEEYIAVLPHSLLKKKGITLLVE